MAFNKEKHKINVKRYRLKHPDRIKQQNTEYRSKNRGKILVSQKVYNSTRAAKTSKKKYANNSKNIINKKEYDSAWKRKNRNKINESLRNKSPEIKSIKNAKLREWYFKNREAQLEKRRNRYHNGYKETIRHKEIWRSVLNKVLVRMGGTKKDCTIKTLGYSHAQLKKHIENLFLDGMTWDNYGQWEIDHVYPVSKFLPNTPMHIVNALSNLQPLWWQENRSKSNKLNSDIIIDTGVGMAVPQV